MTTLYFFLTLSGGASIGFIVAALLCASKEP